MYLSSCANRATVRPRDRPSPSRRYGDATTTIDRPQGNETFGCVAIEISRYVKPKLPRVPFAVRAVIVSATSWNGARSVTPTRLPPAATSCCMSWSSGTHPCYVPEVVVRSPRSMSRIGEMSPTLLMVSIACLSSSARASIPESPTRDCTTQSSHTFVPFIVQSSQSMIIAASFFLGRYESGVTRTKKPGKKPTADSRQPAEEAVSFRCWP